MKERASNNISSEMLAAFIDGEADAVESRLIVDALSNDAALREVLKISAMVDEQMERFSTPSVETLPMMALAASSGEGCYCTLECERYLLEMLGESVDEDQLLDSAVRNGWLKSDGTPLYNVGRHLESFGYSVTRQYKCSVNDIAEALAEGLPVMVVVDGGELLGNRVDEMREDRLIGEIPDHTVVVLRCDLKAGSVTIYDPNSEKKEDTYPLEQFEDAWSDSKNYLVTINSKEMKTYRPKPIDLSGVELSDELNELREAIAENAHNVWAYERQAQGWSYGPTRDDVKKQTPCMVPYSELPDSEKLFDRQMAMNTLKLVQKLGYDIVKRDSTPLCNGVQQSAPNAAEKYHCPYCERPVEKFQVYCDHCDQKLDIDWSLHK